MRGRLAGKRPRRRGPGSQTGRSVPWAAPLGVEQDFLVVIKLPANTLSGSQVDYSVKTYISLPFTPPPFFFSLPPSSPSSFRHFVSILSQIREPVRPRQRRGPEFVKETQELSSLRERDTSGGEATSLAGAGPLAPSHLTRDASGAGPHPRSGESAPAGPPSEPGTAGRCPAHQRKLTQPAPAPPAARRPANPGPP